MIALVAYNAKKNRWIANYYDDEKKAEQACEVAIQNSMYQAYSFAITAAESVYDLLIDAGIIVTELAVWQQKQHYLHLMFWES